MKQMQVTAKHIHFVGIGGCGMSGIADVLVSKGYKVSGSDVKESKNTNYLSQRGIEIFIGHKAENVFGADLVVLSSAIDESNPELISAKNLQIPCVSRAQMLAEIMDEQKGIAIAGTHGKTTTTSLVTTILREAKLDPSFIIGGTLQASGTNAALGNGEYCVAEADESDASFLVLNPKIIVLTNIDVDHLWFYQSNFDILKKTFMDFLHRLPKDGLAIVCMDDPVNQTVLDQIQRPFCTYGFSNEADVQIQNYQQQGFQSRFTLRFHKLDKVLDICLNLPGQHNALNAAAAVIVALEAGANDAAIQSALQNFTGVGRRFQIRGEIDVNGSKATLIDDYGHHPKEIAATLSAAKAAWPDKRIVLAFQPHRYSRTKNLLDDFAIELAKADALILLDIYPAGENPIAEADGKVLQQAILQQRKFPLTFVPRQASLKDVLQNVIEDGDILILQGAGDIGAMATSLAGE